MAELIIVNDKRECHENCTKCTVCTARFVNKDALLEEWNRQSSRGHYEFDQTIIEFPTTTEAEIRNKAIDEAMEKLAEEICTGCGCLKERKCTYKGSNCRVSKIMLEKTMAVLEQLKEG